MSIAVKFERTRQLGLVREVARGIRWIRIPLPFSPFAVNCWALRDGDGWLIVDTGAFMEEALECWRGVMRELGAPSAPVRLLVSHAHPDHCGSAGWFCRSFGASLLMSRADWLLATMYGQEIQPAIEERNAAFYRLCDVDGDDFVALMSGDPSYRYIETMPTIYRRLADGDRIEIDGSPWRVITAGGHCPEHICLYSDELKVLIAGDHILPRIVPTVGASPFEPEADALGDYLGSLSKFRTLSPDTLVLPGHGTPFTGLHAQIDALEAFYRDDLQAICDACITPTSIRNLVNRVATHPPELRALRLLLAEKAARLNTLVAQRRIKRTIDDGVWMHERV
ncbi:MAG: MBL fold metallo-hydrolase [Rhizobiaceae bacterium]